MYILISESHNITLKHISNLRDEIKLHVLSASLPWVQLVGFQLAKSRDGGPRGRMCSIEGSVQCIVSTF